MADDTAPGSDPTADICPWCSATLPSADEVDCPSCGATLTGDVDPQVPGLTAIDAQAIARASQAPIRQQRSRLLSWISGEYDTDVEAAPADSEALAPPDEAVKREILRLELEAEVANLQAENEALIAEARVEEADEGLAAEQADEERALDAPGTAAVDEAGPASAPEESDEAPRQG